MARVLSAGLALVFGAAIGVTCPSMASAQAADTTTRCDGLPVQRVEVQTDRPKFRGPLAWWRRLARSFGLHHATTNAGLVRRFVSLDPGLACTEFRRSESERILRAQPFLADASVVTRQEGESIRVGVETTDEASIVGGARLHGAHLEALNIGTLNFRGAGMHVEGRWEQGGPYRDGIGGKVTHYQLLGRP